MRRIVILALVVPLILTACGPLVNISIIEADQLARIDSWAIVLRHPQSAALEEVDQPESGQIAADTNKNTTAGEATTAGNDQTPALVYPGPIAYEPSPLMQPLIDRIEFDLIAEHNIKIVQKEDADGLIQLSTDVVQQRYHPQVGLVGGRITTLFIRLVDLDGVILAVLKVEADTTEHNAKILAETAAKRIAKALQHL